MIRKISFVLPFILLLFISVPHAFCSAVDANTIQILEEISLPQDLNFTINKTCSGHAYFMQAAADENGCFAVYSRHINPDDHSEFNLKRVYIDIYQPDGSFLQELSFITSLDFAFEFKNSIISIYFYNSVLFYNLITQELSHYSIPDGSAVNGGLYEQLRSKTFTVGNWTYRYKKGFNGYVKLIRSNNQQEQILVEMPGSGNLLRKVIIPGGAVGILTTVIIVWQIKRKHNPRKGPRNADN